METNNKIEEEQEETKSNLSPQKKVIKEKILNLEIITSSYISKGTILKITSEGYQQSLRKAKDSITYFGYEILRKKDNEVSIKI